MSHLIRLMHPQLPTEEQLTPYLRRMDETGWYTNHGPLVQELELSMKLLLHAPTVAVANATLGLELAIQAAGLRRKRILLPALTFRATANAVLRTGNYLTLADIDPDTWQLTPEIAKRYLGRFDAIIPVATYGRPVEVAGWAKLSHQLDVPVIIDAAAAFGAQEVDSVTAVVFSLHATKPLAAGEGGIVASHDPHILTRVRQLSQFEEAMATNAKMSEYHAAVALASLRQWENIAMRRLALRGYYLSALRRVRVSVGWQQWPHGAIPSLIVLRLYGVDTQALVHRMRENNVEAKRWYCPTVDEWMDQPTQGLEVTKSLRRELIGLPFHLRLSDADVDTVLETLEAQL